MNLCRPECSGCSWWLGRGWQGWSRRGRGASRRGTRTRPPSSSSPPDMKTCDEVIRRAALMWAKAVQRGSQPTPVEAKERKEQRKAKNKKKRLGPKTKDEKSKKRKQKMRKAKKKTKMWKAKNEKKKCQFTFLFDRIPSAWASLNSPIARLPQSSTPTLCESTLLRGFNEVLSKLN